MGLLCFQYRWTKDGYFLNGDAVVNMRIKEILLRPRIGILGVNKLKSAKFPGRITKFSDTDRLIRRFHHLSGDVDLIFFIILGLDGGA